MMDDIWIVLKITLWAMVVLTPILIIYDICSTHDFKKREFRKAELIDIESRTYRKNATGRSIMGYMAFGDVGAILGALSAEERQEVTYVFRVTWEDFSTEVVRCHYNDPKYRKLLRLDQKLYTVSCAPEFTEHQLENTEDLITLGELREGTELRVRVDCKNSRVTVLSKDGKTLARLPEDTAREIIGRFSGGMSFTATAASVDYTGARLLKVTIQENR